MVYCSKKQNAEIEWFIASQYSGLYVGYSSKGFMSGGQERTKNLEIEKFQKEEVKKELKSDYWQPATEKEIRMLIKYLFRMKYLD
jgi:hypothetical protein